MVVAENMEKIEENENQAPIKKSLTFLGEPIVKTRCQRNALISAISGGIMTGLVTFLFTSRARTSTRAAVGSFFVITVAYSCYCSYDEIQMRKERRMLRQAMFDTHKASANKRKVPEESSPKPENS